jgi:phage portal protein BeeE
MQDETGTLFIHFFFRTGYNYILPYADIIHLRKKFSINDIMGGGFNGEPDNQALLQTLQINDTVLQGVGKAVNTSLNIRGILKINTLMDDAKQQAERTKFEENLTKGVGGILPLDLKGDFTPITIDPKIIDSATLQFLESKVLRWYGVPLCILNGDYTDDQYAAFYAMTIEPIVVSLGQAFTNALFTPTEQSFDNEIVFYGQSLELMSVKNKLAIADTLGGRGALTNNFLLSMFGIPPYDGGDVRIASLNYINANIMDAYQMAKASKGAVPLDEGGDNNNGSS